MIEDAAHALGSIYQGERIGAFSDFAAFSFYPIKNITAAEGGMAVTNGRISAEVIRQLSWYGLSEDPWDRARQEAGLSSVVLMPGLKCNMTDLQAAIGLAQLQQLERFNAIRAQYARLYKALLQDVEEIALPPDPQEGCKSSWHLFVIRLRLNQLRINREEFCRAMAQRNIGTSYHYKSLHLHPYYRDHFGYKELDFPVAAAASRSVVSLPLYPAMGEADVEAVVDAIKDVLAKALR